MRLPLTVAFALVDGDAARFGNAGMVEVCLDDDRAVPAILGRDAQDRDPPLGDVADGPVDDGSVIAAWGQVGVGEKGLVDVQDMGPRARHEALARVDGDAARLPAPGQRRQDEMRRKRVPPAGVADSGQALWFPVRRSDVAGRGIPWGRARRIDKRLRSSPGGLLRRAVQDIGPRSKRG